MPQKRSATTTVSTKAKVQKKQKSPTEPVPSPSVQGPRCKAIRNWPMIQCSKRLTMYERWDGMGSCFDCHSRCIHCGAEAHLSTATQDFAECSVCDARACPDCAAKHEWKTCASCSDCLCTLRACVAERSDAKIVKCCGGCDENLCNACIDIPHDDD